MPRDIQKVVARLRRLISDSEALTPDTADAWIEDLDEAEHPATNTSGGGENRVLSVAFDDAEVLIAATAT